MKKMTLRKNKELNLSKCIITALLLFAQSVVSAQINVYGNWSIDKILDSNDFQEYSIVKQDDRNPWGNILTLNLDGTFLCGNRAPCGNDVFRVVSGDFVKVGDSHIRFIVKRKSSSSYGKVNHLDSNLNKDLGIFYIYEDANSIRLIQSSGNLQEDKDRMLYSQMLDFFTKEWKSYDFAWENTDGNQPDEILKDCKEKTKQIDLSNCNIVFSRNESYGDIFLLRENESFYYVVYNAINKKVSLAYPK
ncbi:hypothetical protein LPB248_15165 [Flavobacterium sp. LPB0248]|uniref:hypothetical protein n=1 Tax=Flavobacterium sp. LPB0248 TaxID=2614441 RepID=UPI0015A543EC|nr:hypothetical protein [Flavobacterium sp. LPB0248]QLC67597.1 hypothetical protein LPB248_15165 [Flavobacterium sp. LPB0248]